MSQGRTSVRAACAIIGLLVAAGALSMMVGCPPKHELLYQSVSEFNNGLRWKKWEDAGAFMPPGLRVAFLQSLEKEKADDRLNITDFEVKEVLLDDEAKHAVVRVRLAWYFNDSGIEKKSLIIQKWERIEDKWAMMAMEGEGPWKPEAVKAIDLFPKDAGDADGSDAGPADR